MTVHKLLRTTSGQLQIDQHAINGWTVSWCPDDSRFHVAVDEKYASSAATFKELRNAVRWAKTHEVTPERRKAAGL